MWPCKCMAENTKKGTTELADSSLSGSKAVQFTSNITRSEGTQVKVEQC